MLFLFLLTKTIQTINSIIEMIANIPRIRLDMAFMPANITIFQEPVFDRNQNIKLTIIRKSKTKIGDNRNKVDDFFILRDNDNKIDIKQIDE